MRVRTLMWKASHFERLGNSLTVGHSALDRAVMVRIHVPQPSYPGILSSEGLWITSLYKAL